MTITHAELVANLAKPGAEIIADLTPEKADLLHMAVGVSGEVGELIEGLQYGSAPVEELDRENVVEELGDCEFYLERIQQIVGDRFDVVVRVDIPFNGYPIMAARLIARLSVNAARLLDTVKKHAIYNKELDVVRVCAAGQLIRGDLLVVGHLIDSSHKEVIAANIAKLSKRYSSGSYSNDQAQQRADKQEG